MTGELLLPLLALVGVAAVVAVVVALISDDRDPSIVLAWLLVILLVPLLGVAAYFLLGRNHRRDAHRRGTRPAGIVREQAGAAGPRPAEGGLPQHPVAVRDGEAAATRRVEATGRREDGARVTTATSARIYFSGADRFRDLFEDLRSARESIHLMYLIWERDELTSQVTAILLDRLAAGVQVYVMYDWLSSMRYPKSELRSLSDAGASVVPCYRRLSRLNYRNHMKMAIVDRRVVYSGGLNMGQEYVDGGRRFPSWRDTDFRLTGPAVAPYLTLFASVWLADGNGELPEASLPGPPDEGVAKGATPVHVLHSSVSTRFPAIRDAYLVALTSAGSRVWIQSPYFVPDEPLLTAMCVAASSGVDVRLMMTGLPDKKLPFYAAQTYIRTVLGSGVRVFSYRAGFLHAKTVTVDEELAVIGTCNWDIRSLILHDEVVAVFYEPGVARTCAEQYERDLSQCTELTAEQLDGLGAAEKLRNQVCRLFSRLL